MSTSDVLGHYVTCDDALCVECFERAGGEVGWNERGGFEGWPEPIAILDSAESDSPTHCDECGRVIEHPLTSEGERYVAEAIVDDFAHGKQSPVVALWINAYADELPDEIDGIEHSMATAISLHALLPRDKGWAEIEHCRKYAVQAGWVVEP